MHSQRRHHPASGSYVLVMELAREQDISVGRRSLHFPRGYYAYVGSGMGGVKARVNRHLRPDKRVHWHIDYLLQRASLSDVIIGESTERTECAIACALGSQFDAIPGFGSSDCRCPSHLFFATEDMRPKIRAVLSALGMRPRRWKGTRVNQKAEAISH